MHLCIFIISPNAPLNNYRTTSDIIRLPYRVSKAHIFSVICSIIKILILHAAILSTRKNCWKYILYLLYLLCFLEICVPKNAVQAICPKWHHTGHECLSLWERTPCLALLQTFCDWVLLESELINRCMKINKILSNVKSFLFFCCVCNTSQNDCALPFAEPVLNLLACVV